METARESKISKAIHNAIYKDKNQSLCSRAYQKKDECRFWKIFVFIRGTAHCKDSYHHYHKEVTDHG